MMRRRRVSDGRLDPRGRAARRAAERGAGADRGQGPAARRAVGAPVSRRIEAVSFVHPKAIPQMADADEVWAARRSAPGVRYSALVPNSRGAQRALAAGFREIEVVVSASDTHNRRNVNRSTEESLDDIAGLIDAGARRRRQLEVIISTSFGCPYEGTSPRRGWRPSSTGWSPTAPTGSPSATPPAWPRRAGCADVLDAVRDRHPDCRLLLHFHNTRGTALANILTALRAGHHRVRRERRRARRLPVRAGRHRQRGHRGGRAHAARHGHRHRHRPRPR